MWRSNAFRDTRYEESSCISFAACCVVVLTSIRLLGLPSFRVKGGRTIQPHESRFATFCYVCMCSLGVVCDKLAVSVLPARCSCADVKGTPSALPSSPLLPPHCFYLFYIMFKLVIISLQDYPSAAFVRIFVYPYMSVPSRVIPLDEPLKPS